MIKKKKKEEEDISSMNNNHFSLVSGLLSASIIYPSILIQSYVMKLHVGLLDTDRRWMEIYQ